MGFKPTKEQVKIFNFIKRRKENLLIEAYAGCGKTTSIVSAINLIPKDKSILFMAFNKHIREELKDKLPEHVRSYTSHGLGLSALKRKYGDKIEMDEFKIDKIVRKKSSKWDLKSEFKNDEEVFKYLNDLKKLTNHCRLTLTLDPKYIPYVAERYDININQQRGDVKRVLKILDASIQDTKTFDFTDMIYMPAIDKSIWLFPQDYVFVDEVQDLNRCQIRLIEKMLKKDRVTKKYTGRLIAVGDCFQNIYGFAGSDERSFDWFRKFPNTSTLPLSYSFRCSKKIIEHANRIVPNIKALDTAPEGCVREGNVLNEASDGDFILCRTTKPLVKLFFNFLIQHKKAVIKGGDVGLQLIELIGNIKSIDILIGHWQDELALYKDELRKNGVLNPMEHSGYVALSDKVETLLFLARLSNSIQDLKDKIQMIFTEDLEGIVLSTIHKAKGLEANRVFIIRPDLIPFPGNVKGWQYAQEKNLEYVAITRAKTELIYDDQWTDEDE